MGRKIFVFIIILFLGLSISFGADRFIVHEVKGTILIKNKTGWTAIKKGDALRLNDCLDIKPNGTIRIIDKNSNIIHSSTKTGETTLKALIDLSNKQSENILKLMMAELGSRVIKNDGSSSKSAYNATGVTFRGDENNNDSVAINLWRWLNIIIDKYEQEGTNGTGFIGVDKNYIDETGEIFTFTVTNKNSNPSQVNILRINPSEKVLNLLLDHSFTPLILEGGESVNIPLELLEDKEDYYLIFATSDGYDISFLEHLLRNKTASDSHQPPTMKIDWLIID